MDIRTDLIWNFLTINAHANAKMDGIHGIHQTIGSVLTGGDAMKAKDFFRQVLRAESELKQLRSRLAHYEEIGLTITPSNSGTGSGGQKSTSRVELAAIGMVDATAHLIDEIKKYQSIVNRAEAVIAQVPQEKYRLLLNYRYLCGWSFRSISDELRYNDPNSIYRAHGWALSAAQKIIDGKEG